jgi:hypothetical protein
MFLSFDFVMQQIQKGSKPIEIFNNLIGLKNKKAPTLLLGLLKF